ncbi:hypothetical protein C8R45DRAFT_995595 [Mycena sanguinolenta]|nr:hypothetical protein C8R45DRAFT_995595 [Mycena sanguinolenta]
MFCFVREYLRAIDFSVLSATQLAPNTNGQPIVSRSSSILSLTTYHPHMNTLSQILTVLQVYLGDLLARLLALFNRSNVKSTVVVLASNGDFAGSPSPDKASETEIATHGFPTTSPELESAPTDNDCTGDDLLRAAVDFDLDALPSLPSLFNLPEPRPPIQTPVSVPCKQNFGSPSHLYYDRRPFGNVANFRHVEEAKAMKLNTDVKPLKMVKSKSACVRRTRPAAVTIRPLTQDPAFPVVKIAASSSPPSAVTASIPTPHPRSSSDAPSAARVSSVDKLSASVHPIPTVKLAASAPLPQPSPLTSAPVARLAPVDNLSTSARPPSIPQTFSLAALPAVDATSAPGSREWNSSKAAVLAQARTWNRQVQTSGRHRSLPIPAPADEPWKR